MWEYKIRSKTDSLFLFENYYGIPVSTWKKYNVTRMRNITKNIGSHIIVGEELVNNWSIIRPEKRQ